MEWRFWFGLTLSLAACSLMASPVAANRYLDQGIKEYYEGNYPEAVGLLGQAEATDFNNPVLHYYLANALSKTNQKADAIKEYKIALAMEPKGQLADYCVRALRDLGELPVPVSGRMGIRAKQPRMICILCGCPQCRRLEPILRALESKYGDRIHFTRAMQNAIDPDTKEFIRGYNVSVCPTILEFDRKGWLSATHSGVILETELRRDVEKLAAGSPRQPKGTSEENLFQIRNSIIGEAQSRVDNDQKRLNEEIKMIQNEESMQILDLPRRGYARGYEIQQIREEAQRKINALNRDFEKRRAEVFAAAQARIEALTAVHAR